MLCQECKRPYQWPAAWLMKTWCGSISANVLQGRFTEVIWRRPMEALISAINP